MVSFLFAVLLLTVPPCPAICKSGGGGTRARVRSPRPSPRTLCSRRHCLQHIGAIEMRFDWVTKTVAAALVSSKIRRLVPLYEGGTQIPLASHCGDSGEEGRDHGVSESSPPPSCIDQRQRETAPRRSTLVGHSLHVQSISLGAADVLTILI